MKPINTIFRYRIHRLVVFMAALLTPLIYHGINLHYLGRDNPGSIRQGISVVTADDISYLTPAFNFYQGNGWRTNDPGIQSQFQRPPGYSLLYLGSLYIAGEDLALYFLIMFQVFLHALASIAIFEILKKHVPIISGLAGALLYGTLPLFGGFLFYTLTEGVTPALLTFYIFFVWKYMVENGNNRRWLVAATAIFGWLFITRPVLGVFLLLLPMVILFKENKPFVPRLMDMAIIVLLALLPMAIWQARNYQISGTFQGLHPIYHHSNPGIFRPAHKSIWKLCKSWAMEPQHFHPMVHTLFDTAVKGDTSEVYRKKALEYIPEKQRQIIGDQKLLSGFALYQQNSFEQGLLTLNHSLPMPDTLSPAENETIAYFHKLAREYRLLQPIDTWVVAPLRVLNRMVFHSNLNLYIFQQTWRGDPIMETFRLFSFGVHVLLFFALIPALWLLRKHPLWIVTILCYLAYIVYLAWVQRGIEERYTLPLLPFLLINIVIMISLFKIKLT